MPTYVSLINWTDQGIRDFKQTVDRYEAAKEVAAKMGGDLKDVYWTVGPYDLITIADFPDDQTGTAYLLALGSQGNIRTTTMRAHSADEMAQIIGKLS